MGLENRIDRLERRADQEPEAYRPWLYLDQDPGNPDLWHAAGGEDYRQAELVKLGERYRLILVNRHGIA